MTDLLDRSIVSSLAAMVADAPPTGPPPIEPVAAVNPGGGKRPWLLAAAGVLLVAGVAATVAVATRAGDGSTTLPASTADPTSPDPLAPAATLPDSGDLVAAPITAVADASAVWYRLQPDLDLAWQAAADGSTMLCWRTPTGENCRPGGLGDVLVAPSAGGQTLVVVTGRADGSSPIAVELSDGSIRMVAVAWDQQLDLGVARIELDAGVTVTDAGTASSGAPQADGVSGATLAPELGLVESPLTVPEGSELAYWRFLSDLDVSERSTGDGTELCWRTPVGTGCIDDTFESPNVGVIPTDGGAILLARRAVVPIDPPPTDPLAPTLEQGPPLTAVDVTFSDGTTVAVGLQHPEVFVDYARVDVPAGVTVVSATSR